MRISRDKAGNVMIEMDNAAEASDLALDLCCAAEEPGFDVTSPLLSEGGVAQLTVRVAA